MTEKNPVTQENFDALLNWLDFDREAAGEKYEKIRRGLIYIFYGRGCQQAEELADETINRVVLKLPQIVEDYVGEQALYFYGVAKNIYYEWERQQNKEKKVPIFDDSRTTESEAEAGREKEAEYECLENCLQTLPAAQRRLVIEYYRHEKIAKVEYRRKLAADAKISLNALQVKMSRLRTFLQNCVRDCAAKKRW